MKRTIGLLGAGAMLATGIAFTAGSAGAQSRTPVVPLFQTVQLPETQVGTADIYAVHGLNLDGQDAQGDGGTVVTVCVDGSELLGQFAFGDIAGPVPLPWGATVQVDVHLGADVACDAPGTVLSQEVTVPSVPAAALVATAGPDGQIGLLPVALDVSDPGGCQPAGFSPSQQAEGRLGGVHAAAAGEVAVLIDGTDAANLAFGDTIFADVPADTYEVAVELGGTPIVGPAPVTVDSCQLQVVYVVGNQALPEPIVPTTTTTTTVPATPVSPPPAAATVTPRFTG